MNDMGYNVRAMLPDDAESLQQLYMNFATSFVGPSTSKSPKLFRRLARKKDKLNWVAIQRKQVVGYISSIYVKTRRQGRINEIVVDPKFDFKAVATPLVDKVCSVFAQKGAASIQAVSIRNPYYQEIFPKLGFFNVRTDGLFMLTIHNIPKFLDEIKPILERRLEKLKDLHGCFQIKCKENSIFFKKTGENVESFVWTNRQADFKLILDEHTLANLLLGALTVEEAIKKEVQIETRFSETVVSAILKSLFPEVRFLAFDFW